jgi:hypothetical protein
MKLREDERYIKLLHRAIDIASTELFESDACVAVAVALSRLGRITNDESKLLTLLAEQVIKQVTSIPDALRLSQMAFAYAKLGRTDPQLFNALARRAIDTVHDMDSQSIGNLCWAMARIDYRPTPVTPSSPTTTTSSSASSSSSGSSVTKKENKDASLFWDAMSSRASTLISGMNSATLANMGWSFAKVDRFPPLLFTPLIK